MVSAIQRQDCRVGEGRQSREELILEAQARSELLRSAYACVRHVACRLQDGVLTLHGHVPSYFHKQVAQSVIRQRVDSSVAIDNQLRVTDTTGRAVPG